MAEPQTSKAGAPSQSAASSAPEIKHLVRIANTDLDGKKTIAYALNYIKGVGIPFAHAACRMAGIDVNKKAGALTDAELQKVEEIIKNPIKAGLPPWMVNRCFDTETGQHRHLLAGDLQFTIENDIRTMKKIKCYKGIRHILGQPVRGQRTRSNFRKNKGKVMGVRRSAAAKAAGSGTT
ncbi:MAG: 30S ribosomal protein S13 [Candidatus Woesearchaeota archaeon]